MTPSDPLPNDAKPLLKDEAYTALKRQILNETLEPGTFLSERKLAQSMNLGLTPIRQALQRLASEGFLRISPRQGAFIIDMSVEEILDLYEIRKVLETAVVRKIAGKLRKEQLQALYNMIDAQRAAHDAGDIEATVSHDMEFHAHLCACARNKEIQRALQLLQDKVYRIIVRSLRAEPDRMEEITGEHSKILDAIERSDGDAAAHWVDVHLEAGKRFVLLR